jgi:hypothetical protein
MTKLYILILTSFVFIGTFIKVHSIAMDKIDVQSYASASAIVQKMNGPLDSLSKISEVVKQSWQNRRLL